MTVAGLVPREGAPLVLKVPLRISTLIYLFLVSGALVAAGLQAVGVGETASFVLGYGVVFLVAASVELYRRPKRRSR